MKPIDITIIAAFLILFALGAVAYAIDSSHYKVQNQISDEVKGGR